MGYFLAFSDILGAFELSDMDDRYILHFRDFNLLYKRSVYCFSGYDKISHLFSLSANGVMGKELMVSASMPQIKVFENKTVFQYIVPKIF